MTWTATLKRADKRKTLVVVEIEYQDSTDGDVFVQRYNLQHASKKGIRDLARSEVTRLAALKTADLDLPIGTSIDIDPDVVVPPPAPSAEEVARRLWFRDWDRLQALLRLANAGLLPINDTRITNLQASLQADWVNTYLTEI